MKLLFDVVIFIAFGLALLFAYLTYWDDLMVLLFDEEPKYTIFIDNVPVVVTVADTKETRTQGLSGVQKLGKNEGKFFVFDSNAKHGIWMKDMLLPLDIIWIDEQLNVIHIEERVEPSTYPTIFAPQTEARFVLETNAFFVDSLKVEVGDRLFIPPEILPKDISKNLQ